MKPSKRVITRRWKSGLRKLLLELAASQGKGTRKQHKLTRSEAWVISRVFAAIRQGKASLSITPEHIVLNIAIGGSFVALVRDTAPDTGVEFYV